MTVRKTSQGFLRFKSMFARTGIQEYGAGEMRRWGVPIADGVPDDAIVRVYRDASEVFDEESMKSFENTPITNGHKGTVTPKNFKDLAIGMSLSPVVKMADGRHLSVDILMTREDGIQAYKKGVKQLSAGYSSVISLKGGLTEDGQPYDMKQGKIKGNHIALVPRGRAGTATLLDMRDSAEEEMSQKVHDEAVELGKVRQKLEDAMAEIETLKAERDTLNGKVDTLEAEKLTDEQIAERIAAGVKDARDAEKVREAIITRARLFAPKLSVNDKMTNKDIMVEALKARDPSISIGDEETEGYVRGRFEALEAPKGAPAKGGNVTSTVKTQDAHFNGEKKRAYTFDRANRLLG